ncbi:NAD(P)/FAD-dependent oxidoreductase [Streptomyces oceani]|uniref:Amine oxidase n=1 Tax=Streptomyces oceani TaxID=1075402 RepID=A0A1E7KJY1_9ACTN|nr:FAD-dependent oxidoreductase [Streptomyces oceani]OEV04176.1 amine oxidase [Streptomyces oceani]
MPEGQHSTAVVGSGIAGLTAAYVLRRAHEVTLYEADDRLGGHAHTHELMSPHGLVHQVDSGFIVHNARTYPLLCRLLTELRVPTRESEMSMSVRCEGCGLEYAGARGPRGLFARPRNAVTGDYLRMLTEVPAFHRQARRLLETEPADPADGVLRTLGDFLSAGRFSRYFTAHFAIPLVSAVWSCAPGTALRYPARYLFQFLAHHGMLGVRGSPTWRTVRGGSRSYVERIGKQLPVVHTGDPIRAVLRRPHGAAIVTADGTTRSYDSVVLAVHPDQALRLLAEPSEAERRVLGAFHYSRNETLLHTDDSLLPRRAAARAAWNYLLPDCRPSAGPVQVSYDMRRLQGPDAPERHYVTLGGTPRVRRDQVLARMVYEHPVYTPESVRAQRELPALNSPVLAFAGAYHGWGFHEDGCRSGVHAARALGVHW